MITLYGAYFSIYVNIDIFIVPTYRSDLSASHEEN